MQCAAIPYRKTEAGNLEILLVTSRGKGNWILPKGNVKPGKSAAVSAAEEAYEEAGARGVIDQALVERFDPLWPGKTEGRTSEQMQIYALDVDTVVPVGQRCFNVDATGLPLSRRLSRSKVRIFEKRW